MHEYIARLVYYIGVHLFYASLVWFAAWTLTSIVRGTATTKYWIWVATSLNFILPLGAVLDKSLAAHLSWAKPLGVIGDAGLRVADNATMVGAVWLLGAMLMVGRLCLRIRADRRDAQGQSAVDSTPKFLVQDTPVRFSSARNGPAVDGVLHPHICLPDGIDRLLTKSELNAVLLHELTHARRRDNLIWLIHEIALCLLWFHPLAWVTGFRLALYRELSCDEAVIQSGHGEKLVSALAKLANPEQPSLLQATATSFMGHRLARLAAVQPQRMSCLASALLTVAFGAVLAAGVFATVSHTACCWVART
ncbi:MAG TPA: M56 family metallopeptidase [Candidatus Acidoferrum sp.]|jgi:beta-lactamase regulating signal transducer with metallopeptidase domain|nr:M56 family metallopeptidase [Candidatus Acidoferrum sp.]